VGTGAGLPGIVLAIMNEKEKLELNFSLVDSNKKKIKFLEIVKKELDLNLCLINKRAENIQKKYDIIISRAVAPLDKFFNYSKELIKKDTVFILPKGKTWAKEVDELKKKWNYDVNIVTNNKLIDNSGGVSLIIKQVVIKK
jgi:16S rRNA (guanine527-N7)-methyltransferase